MSMDSKISKVVEVMANDLTYLPSPEQRKLKSAFWLRFSENPICDPRDVGLGTVHQLTQDSRVDRWWGVPGFREWFRNQEEFRERVESMAHLALDTLMVILVTDDPKMSSARVSAAKLLLEVSRKLPSRTATEVGKSADKLIAEMDKKQLDAYIARHMRTLPPVPTPETDDIVPQ